MLAATSTVVIAMTGGTATLLAMAICCLVGMTAAAATDTAAVATAVATAAAGAERMIMTDCHVIHHVSSILPGLTGDPIAEIGDTCNSIRAAFIHSFIHQFIQQLNH
jgi:hypothetical protein